MLGVSVSATHDEVREAYRQLALQTHPDRVAATDELDPADAELLIRAVNEAWHVLGDPVSRATYDADLARQWRDGDGHRSHDSGPDSGFEDDGDERWPADRPSSVIAGLLPLLVLVTLLMLIVVFTAYAKTG